MTELGRRGSVAGVDWVRDRDSVEHTDLRTPDLTPGVATWASPLLAIVAPHGATARITAVGEDIALDHPETIGAEWTAVAVAHHPVWVSNNRYFGTLGDAIGAVVAPVRVNGEQAHEGVRLGQGAIAARVVAGAAANTEFLQDLVCH